MSNTNNWQADFQATVADGMNGGQQPELILESQAALLRNLSIRGGRAHTRPAIVRRGYLPPGRLQGGTVFGKISRLMVSVSGRLYEVDPRTWGATEKTGWLSEDEAKLANPEKDRLRDLRRNSPAKPRHTYCETAGSLVVQDNQSAAIIYDGVSIRRAASDEVPIGGAMAYGNGRLAVAVKNGYAVRIGDIRKDDHQSELKFTETYDLTAGGDFGFAAPVKALAVLPVVDTSSGQGPLIVGCENQVLTLKTNITQRSMWPDVGMETVLLPTRGITGPGAVVAVNQDLYFRSSDGLRALRTSTADYSAPGLAPLSAEVRQRLDFDTPFLLEDAQVAYFDNRVLCTHSPMVYWNRSLAQGLVALNFDSISGRGQKSNPAFDGEWDGVVVASIVVGHIDGVERCFILGRVLDGRNAVWELLRETELATEPVTQALESRRFFGGNAFARKTLRRLDVSASEIRGPVTIRAYFRPDGFPYWVPWDEWALTAPAQPLAWGARPAAKYFHLSSRSSPDHVDSTTARQVNTGRSFQVRLEVEGRCRIDDFTVYTEAQAATPYAEVPPAPGSQAAGVPDWVVQPGFWHRNPASPLDGLS
jgi:hypothetical protein